jgi:hypothetical protein
MNMKEMLKTRSGKVVFFIFPVALSIYTFFGFRDLVRQTHTREVAKEFYVAGAELRKSPPGLERAETFLKRIKSIDPGYSPPEVKAAMKDYISATENALDAMKAGHSTEQCDKAMADAKERLLAAFKKWG